MKPNQMSRRSFIRGTTASAFAITIVPRSAWGANDRVNVACIGIGGKGRSDMTGAASAGANIVALCDVDMNRIGRRDKDPRDLFPNATFYRDYRVLLDKEDANIDAVTVSTPDHSHCPASVMAMRRGKHVYCQKPLTYSIGEARLMAETARENKVATQMGNQAHAGEPIRRAVEYIRAGLLGKVSEVHCWTNRPIWPQGLSALPEPKAVPDDLSWNLWLGPAARRPYSPAYCPFSWRGWWDFGTGALGDMGCHIMDMPYWALDLKHPTHVEADSKGNTPLSGPTESTVTYRFPAGPYSHDLTFSWYDGGRMPSADVLSGFDLPADQIAKRFDLVMIGDRGKLLFQRGRTEWLTSPSNLLDEFEAPAPSLPRVSNEDVEWIEACKGGPPALSRFELSGPFTEVVLLGNLAIRVGQPIEWDGENLRATNVPEAEALIHREYRKGWEL